MSLRETKIPLLLNFSQCKLSLQEFYPVIEHCSEVLEAEPGSSFAHAIFLVGE